MLAGGSEQTRRRSPTSATTSNPSSISSRTTPARTSTESSATTTLTAGRSGKRQPLRRTTPRPGRPIPFSANGSTGSTSTSTSDPPSWRTRSEIEHLAAGCRSHRAGGRSPRGGRARRRRRSPRRRRRRGHRAQPARPTGPGPPGPPDERRPSRSVRLLQGDRGARTASEAEWNSAITPSPSVLATRPTVRLDDLTGLTEVLRHLGHAFGVAGFDQVLAWTARHR